VGGLCHTHLIMSQSVRTKNKPPRASGPREGDRVTRLEVRTENSATKTDLAAVKGELKSDLAEVKGELKSDLAEVKGELKADIAALHGRIDTLDEKMTQMQENMVTKADLVETENRILRWMIGSMISIVALVVVLVRFL